jgi:hypothetical protein
MAHHPARANSRGEVLGRPPLLDVLPHQVPVAALLPVESDTALAAIGAR